MNAVEQITIFGGGEIGFLVADTLESSDYEVELIESDPDRARVVAERLPDTLVLNHDATDGDFLLEEHVDESDVIVSALDSDEKNLLISLFTKKLGVDRAISVVEKDDYVHLFQDVGIDAAVNPRLLTAEEISRYTRGKNTQNVAILEHQDLEVLEFVLDDESPLLDRSLQDIVTELPSEVVFGPILRHGDIIIPRGDTMFREGDHVILLTQTDKMDEIQDQI